MRELQDYEDIIDLPRPVSASHPQMPIRERAAQFAPFAALTGHDAAVRETARLTEDWVEPAEDVKAYLDESLGFLKMHLKEQPEVTISYFEPDERKAGGSYRSVTGRVKKIEELERRLVMQEGSVISLDCIVDLQYFK